MVTSSRSVFRRYLQHAIQHDALADRKMAFVSGPRQVGKTTLGRALLESSDNEFSWDDQRFRRAWSKDPVAAVAGRGAGPILLDELHKDRRWKNRLKGLYDLRGGAFPIVVTGSARLDLFRRGGDSLLGRFVPYRLHPFSVAECDKPPAPDAIGKRGEVAFPVDALLNLGGFPEPLLAGSEAKANRWSRLRRERLVYEDLRDLRHVNDLQAMRVLVDLLPERVCSLLSVNSLREDVGVAYATVRDWIGLLEAVYHLFLVRPFAGTMKRTLKAEPKLYLYDILQLEERSARLENLAALHLLKACHYWTDLAQGDFELRFLRTREKEEVDFVVTRDRKPWLLVECKSGATTPAPTLVKYAARLKTERNIQLVDKIDHDRFYPESKVRVIGYQRFLAGLV
ncbi:MAG: ATP-binding protein [Deltaproteobacteria bacterium]|nr:ATP-binding protein [Deltaproteobacteria bacterium]